MEATRARRVGVCAEPLKAAPAREMLRRRRLLLLLLLL
jgi:hypothetical protein